MSTLFIMRILSSRASLSFLYVVGTSSLKNLVRTLPKTVSVMFFGTCFTSMLAFMSQLQLLTNIFLWQWLHLTVASPGKGTTFLLQVELVHKV